MVEMLEVKDREAALEEHRTQRKDRSDVLAAIKDKMAKRCLTRAMVVGESDEILARELGVTEVVQHESYDAMVVALSQDEQAVAVWPIGTSQGADILHEPSGKTMAQVWGKLGKASIGQVENPNAQPPTMAKILISGA